MKIDILTKLISLQLPYYAYLYEKPGWAGPEDPELAANSSMQCKPGTTNSTAMAVSAMAAAMAERAAFNINSFRSPEASGPTGTVKHKYWLPIIKSRIRNSS